MFRSKLHCLFSRSSNVVVSLALSLCNDITELKIYLYNNIYLKELNPNPQLFFCSA